MSVDSVSNSPLWGTLCSPAASRERQAARLRQLVRRAYERVPWYRARLDAHGVRAADINALDDIEQLPFLSKSDFRETYPYGMLACPLSDVVRLHTSSGTTGKPTVVAYTATDVQVWTEVTGMTLQCCGIGASDIVQNAFGYGLFTGGLGLHYGAEALGATVLPASGGNTDRQLAMLTDFGTTAICCTPSYFLHLLGRAECLNIDFRTLPLRVGVFGAEPWSEAMRDHIQELADIEAFDIYGLSEVIGPGVASECRVRDGLHVFEDHFYPEIVDPESGRRVAEGDVGELVLTALSKEAMPTIRYRTGDITAFVPGDCPCGRPSRRIRRVSRRYDDMFIIRGVNVYPAQIEEALLRVEGVAPHYQMFLWRERGLDQIHVEVERSAENPPARCEETLRSAIDASLRRSIGIRVEFDLKPPHTIPRSEGKARRVIDHRLDPMSGKHASFPDSAGDRT